MMVFASWVIDADAAEGRFATISVAMLAKVTPAGAEPGDEIRLEVAAATAVATCASLAAVDPDGTGLKRDTPPGRKLFTNVSSLNVAPVIPLPGGFTW